MTIGERIKRVRRTLNLTQAEFAARIGSVQNTLTGYENGRRNPSAPVISLICERFGVNEEWLRTGKGEMMKAAPTDELDALARKYHLQHKDYVLIEKLLKMPQEQRDGVFRFMQDVVAGATAFGANPYAFEFPQKNVHDWTDAEMHAELQRQLDAEKEETDELSTSSSGNSGTAIA